MSSVDEITPPMTTVASGRCTSAPTPVLSAIGTKPSAATAAVMSTGRSRESAASRIASSSGSPRARSWRTRETSTMSPSTDTPERAMNPTAAEIENGSPRASSATTPPDHRERHAGEDADAVEDPCGT